MVSVNTICFEGICRIYRNAFVSHLRQTTPNIRRNQEKHPTSWEESLPELFKHEWEKIRENAELRRRTGELGVDLIGEIDLLDVNHFYNVIEKFFDDLFPSTESMPETTRKQARVAVLGWVKEIRAMRDPVTGHPAFYDIPVADAERMLDSARRVLEWFDIVAAEQIDKLRQTLRSPENSDSGYEQKHLEASTLPSRESVAPMFVGRQVELKELSNWLKDTFSRCWLLAGDGGKGKTAIAYQFAVNTCEDLFTKLEIVIWLSAKRRRLVEGSSIDIEAPDFWDLDSALDCILSAYGVPEFDSMNAEEKSQACLEYLSLLPALVVLDDVDSLEDGDEAMSFFVHKTHATPSKFLLTSRRVPFGMGAMNTQVKGFEPGSKEGREFINSRVRRFDLEQSSFATHVMDNILTACDGSPLFIEDLLRLCKTGEPVATAINRWRTTEGEDARRYALGREFEMLSETAKKALLTCALFPGAVSLADIRVASEISESECASAIRELQSLFLVPRPHLIEGVPRFGLNVNTRQLVVEVQGKTDLAQRILTTIKVFTGQAPATPRDRQQIGQYIRQAVSLIKLNEHAEAEKTLLRALELYPENSDLRGSLGFVYKTWKPQPRYMDARGQFVRAAELKSLKEDTYRHWWEMEQWRREWTSSAEAAERGLEILESSVNLSYMAGLARSQLAKDLYQQAQYNRAEQEAHKAEGHLKNALINLDDVEQGQYQFHSRVHRATVINYEHLVRISQFQQDNGAENHFLRLLARSLQHWENEHPNDSDVSSEKGRLLHWFPNLGRYL